MPYPEERMKTVYTIVESKGDRQRWVRIGIGFVNRDESINVRLDAMPVNGKIHIREFVRREAENGASAYLEEATVPGLIPLTEIKGELQP